MTNHIRRLIHHLGPDIVALIVFTLLWIVTMLFYGAKLHFVEGSTVIPSIIVIFLISAGLSSHFFKRMRKSGHTMALNRRIGMILRHWLPLILLVGVYETLRDYTGIIRPTAIDDQLYRWDIMLFGVEPVIWIQQFIHPLLTDYFAFMYVLYFFLPMLVATLLYVRGWFDQFRELALSCVLCMYTGYLLYLIFPAGPPRFHADLPFEPLKLTGFFGFYDWTQSTMDTSSMVLHHSSFPSLHAALSLLAVLHAWRHGHVWRRRYLVAINAWIAASIWLATIYLRHHWLVDLFAGWLLAIVAFYGARLIQANWHYLLPHSDRRHT